MATTENASGVERVEYHHPDRLGTRLTTNQHDTTTQEQATLPFGNVLSSETSATPSTSRRFTSYDRSSVTRLDYAVNRSYDPLQGRFTTVDPIGMDSVDMNDPQTLNLYAYCINDPINQIDPDGLFFKKLFKWIGKIFKILKWIVVAVVVALAVIAVVSLPAFGAVLSWLGKGAAALFFEGGAAASGFSLTGKIVGGVVMGLNAIGAISSYQNRDRQISRRERRRRERQRQASRRAGVGRTVTVLDQAGRVIDPNRNPTAGTRSGTVEHSGEEMHRGRRIPGRPDSAPSPTSRPTTLFSRFRTLTWYGLRIIGDIIDPPVRNLDLIVDPHVLMEIACREDPLGANCLFFRQMLGLRPIRRIS